LVTNLLQNAVKHNLPGGVLHVATGPNGLLVRNTGPVPLEAVEHFFERFRKHDPTTDSPGLGLAIVAQITRIYGLSLAYTFAPATAEHVVRIGNPPDAFSNQERAPHRPV
jgi:signal transduction histidine kinase